MDKKYKTHLSIPFRSSIGVLNEYHRGTYEKLLERWKDRTLTYETLCQFYNISVFRMTTLTNYYRDKGPQMTKLEQCGFIDFTRSLVMSYDESNSLYDYNDSPSLMFFFGFSDEMISEWNPDQKQK